jgi:hypothetical protein
MTKKILHFIRVTVPDGMELKFPKNFLDIKAGKKNTGFTRDSWKLLVNPT